MFSHTAAWRTDGLQSLQRVCKPSDCQDSGAGAGRNCGYEVGPAQRGYNSTRLILINYFRILCNRNFRGIPRDNLTGWQGKGFKGTIQVVNIKI